MARIVSIGVVAVCVAALSIGCAKKAIPQIARVDPLRPCRRAG
jgi:hypothetical protein